KKIEQRICLKFCIANGISCAESLKMLQKAYGESTLSKTRAYEWYSALKSGRDVVKDLPRSGRPSTSSTEVNIDKVKEMVIENRHFSLREIAAELTVSHESIRTILRDCLGMKRVAARLVPKDLNFLQKLNRVKVAEDMLERVNSDPTFIKRIITGDET
ncbi:FLJ37770-like protein, partial [Acromyrmex echinatior]